VVGRVTPKWKMLMHEDPDTVIAAPDKSWQSDISALAEELAKRVADDPSVKIYFAFNHFKSMLEQIPAVEEIWPPRPSPENAASYANAIAEPETEIIIQDIVLPWIHASLARAWWETSAGENYARLLSMKSANENASLIIDHLSLQYNKTRQLVITQELSEITNASNVLNLLKSKGEEV
jgi:F-type H+-transporting ATPase subunit gamma